jgi:hypothetical protein
VEDLSSIKIQKFKKDFIFRNENLFDTALVCIGVNHKLKSIIILSKRRQNSNNFGKNLTGKANHLTGFLTETQKFLNGKIESHHFF